MERQLTGVVISSLVMTVAYTVAAVVSLPGAPESSASARNAASGALHLHCSACWARVDTVAR